MGELMKIGDIGPNTPVTIPTGEGAIAMSVSDVLKWVAPTAPPGEALRFLMFCRAAELNPFLGEATFVNFGGQWTPLIGKSGWLKRAERHPQFAGFEAGIVVQPVDTSTKPPTPIGPPEEHEGALHLPGYRLIGGWCRVYRKDRERPISMRVALSEYEGPGPNWRDRKATMIRKVALVQALREAGFLTPGGYDRDEMPEMDGEALDARVISTPSEQIPAAARAAIDVEFQVTPTHQLDSQMAEELESTLQQAGVSDWHRDQMLARRGVTSIVELSENDARTILGKLYHILDQQKAGEILLPDPTPAQPS